MPTRKKAKNRYSAHNFATRASFSALVSVHDSNSNSVAKSSWAFPDSYAANVNNVGSGTRPMVDNGKTKGFKNSPSRYVSVQVLHV